MSPRKEIRFIVLEKRFDNETTMSPDQPMASTENGKTAANQQDHSHHCIPSTYWAVMPPIVGVISAIPCINVDYAEHCDETSSSVKCWEFLIKWQNTSLWRRIMLHVASCLWTARAKCIKKRNNAICQSIWQQEACQIQNIRRIWQWRSGVNVAD